MDDMTNTNKGLMLKSLSKKNLLRRIFHRFDLNEFAYAMRLCRNLCKPNESDERAQLLRIIFPSIAKYLSTNCILQCRELSKSIKEGIDKMLYHSINLSTPVGFDHGWWYLRVLDKKVMETLEKSYKFHIPLSDYRIQPFQSAEMLVQHAGKPQNKMALIGNSVTFQFAPASCKYDFNDKAAIHLLDQFGNGVKILRHCMPVCCDIVHLPFMSTVLKLFLSLSSMLCRVKQIEILHIDWQVQLYREDNSSDEKQNVFLEPWQAPKHTENFDMFAVKFPQLTSLTSLYYCYEGGYSTVIGLSLLRVYGSQLNTFTCNGVFLDTDRLIFAERINLLLQNLKNLKVCDPSPKTAALLSQLNLCLKGLQLVTSGKTKKLETCDVLKIVNNFADTLTQLKFDNIFAPKLSQSFLMELRKIRELKQLKQISTHMNNLDSATFFEFLGEKCKRVEVLDFFSLGYTHVQMLIKRDNRNIKRFFKFIPDLKLIRLLFDEQAEKNKYFYR